MTDPRQNTFLRARELFERLVDLSSEERLEALAAECGQDELLLERVRALLAADAGTDLGGQAVARGFAEADAAAEAIGRDASGASIGRYRLVRRIATGGMGEVYEAEQTEPLERRVALKLVRPGFGAPELLRRFDSERQVVSTMSHSGIARVFDAGTAEDGRPYFVMELVDGEPIDRYCDQRGLGLDQRLELFLRVCDAVQHAHRRGVVHRDLKPSNLLVTTEERGSSERPGASEERPIPKVIDFGIAKALEPRAFGVEAPQTVVGTTLGTPEYMSPEQAGALHEIDTRTDVYSLGVVLYELLVGSLPIGHRPTDPRSIDARPIDPGGDPVAGAVGLDEARRRIREEVPERLSERAARLDADDPRLERRRTDAETLRRRLRGDLEWICAKALEKEPDRRYDSVGELAADVRRHLEHLPVLAGPPSWGYRLRKLARRHTVAASVVALIGLGLALGVAGLAVGLRRARAAERRAQLEAERTRRVASFLASTISGLSARELGDSILAELRAAVAEPEDGGESAAQALDRLVEGVNRPDLARSVLGEQILERAASTVENELGDDPDVQARLLLTIADAYSNLSLLEPAERWARRVLELVPEGGERTLQARHLLGDLLRRQGLYDQALAMHRETLAARRRLLGDLHPDTLSSLTSLASVEIYRRRYEEAEPYAREAYEGRRVALGEDDPSTLRALYGYGSVNVRLGRYDEAEGLLRRGLDRALAVLGEDSEQTVQFRGELANLYSEIGNLAEAEKLQRVTVSRLAAQRGENDIRTLQNLDVLGWMVGTSGRFAEAERTFRRLTPEYTAVLGEEHVSVAFARVNTAWAMAHQGRAVAAERLIRSAMVSEEVASNRAVRDILAFVLLRQGRSDEAVELARDTVGEIEAAAEPGEGRRVEAAHYEARLARALLDRGAPGDVEESEALLVRCVSAYVDAFGPERAAGHYKAAAARSLLADARFRLADDSAGRLEARGQLDQAIRALELAHGADTYAVGDAYLRRGAMAAALGDRAEAMAWVDRALAAGAASLVLRDHPGFAALAEEPGFRERRARGLANLELPSS